MGKTAREVMTGGAECVDENETLRDAAKKLKDLDVGAMPICGEDNRLKGMLTDRDIVVKVLARARTPRADRGRTVRWQAGHDRRRRLGRRGAEDDGEQQGAPFAGDRRARARRDRQHGRPGSRVDEEKVGDLVEAISATS